MNLFYLVCPIGLEKALLKEIRLKGLEEKFTRIDPKNGGVEVECPMETGLSLNYLLRCPTRILLRIKTRKCRDFPKLFKTIGQIEWRNYLTQEKAEWRISSAKSRIIHTDKAKDACEKALEKYFRGSSLSKKIKEKGAGNPLQKIFVRIFEDTLTISLDTSGDLLHVRGGSPDRGKASLRANYAACLLMEFFEFSPPSSAFPSSLVDPMCGTGTFLLEALDFYKPNRNRSFPFESWNFELKLAQEGFSGKKLIEEALGLDLDPKAPERRDLIVAAHDIFSPLPEDLKKKANGALLICNLPYGKRVKIDGDKKTFFQKVVKTIENEFKPSAYGLIMPADVALDKFDIKIPFNNNGIKVNFYLKKLTK